MKKWISLLLAVLLLVSVLPVGAFADEGTAITATANAAGALNIGDTLEVTFRMTNNPGFLAAEFTLQYDSDVLSFTGLKEKEDEDSGDMILDGTLKTGSIAVNEKTGKITWANSTEITGNNPKLFVAQFEVVGVGDSTVGLTVGLLKNTEGTEYKDSVSVTKSSQVTINPIPATSVTLDKTELTLEVDAYALLSATVAPEDTTDKVTWSSSNDSVATVTDKGKVTAVAAGTATITATAGSFSATCTVTVKGDYSVENIPTGSADAYISGLTIGGAEVVSATWEDYTLNVVLASGTADGTQIRAKFSVQMGTGGAFQFGDDFNDEDASYTATATLADGAATITRTLTPLGADYGEGTAETFTLHFTVAQPSEPVVTKYNITVGTCKNGTVTANVTQAAQGETVTLTVSPEPGFALEALTVMAGEKAVEVTNNAFAMPAADVTVSATFKQIPAGYTASLGADVTNVVANETVTVPVTIGNTDEAVTGFNAYDLTLTYDPDVLKILTESGNGMTVSAKDGTLRVLRYGELLELDSVVNLKFKAIGTGQTTVTLTKALVDISENASMKDAREATILDKDQKVTIGGYTVTLPDDFNGDAAVAPNSDYTFTAKDKNYTYTVSATMGGETVTPEQNEDGSFTIRNVTGNLVISVTGKVGKTFNVTLSGLTGNASAQYMADYTATVNRETGASYSIQATIGGGNYTGFTYDASTGKVTIPGKDITGDVTITATKDEGQQPSGTTKITFTGSGADDVQGGATQYAPNGNAFTFEITKPDGYDYTVKLGDDTLTADEDGKYTIPADKITGTALTVTVEKVSHIDVTVSQYLTLDKQTAFLVRATGTVPQGSALACDGGVMFFSTAYDKDGQWLYLVITSGTLTVEDAKAKITTVADAEITTLTKTFDVNETGKVDVNDAQLVYDLYNNKYQDFTVVSMQKFLKADTNADGAVSVEDSAAIIGSMNTTQTAG